MYYGFFSNLLDAAKDSGGNSVYASMATFAAGLVGLNALGEETNLTIAQSGLSVYSPPPYDVNTTTVGTWLSISGYANSFRAGLYGNIFIMGDEFPRNAGADQNAVIYHELLHGVLGSHVDVASALGLPYNANPLPGVAQSPEEAAGLRDMAAGNAINQFLKNDCKKLTP